MDAPTTLPDDPTALRAIIAEQQRTLAARDATIAAQQQTLDENTRRMARLDHRLAALLRRLYGPRAERLDPAQMLLAFGEQIDAEALRHNGAEADTPEAQAPAVTRRRQRKVRQIPDDLPVHEVVHEVPEEERACPQCGTQRVEIGRDVSRQLDYTPASLFVLEHVRPVCACPTCQGELAQQPPAVKPIEKGMAGPGLIAYIAVSKYGDHSPLNRQVHILARHGVRIPRSTTCNWMAAAAERVRPIVTRMHQRVLDSNVIQTDDTPVPFLDRDGDRGDDGAGNRDLRRTRTGRLWVYRGDERNPFVLLDFTPTRSRDGPARILAGYEGHLQADAYAGYDHLFADGRIIEVGCWAHARRKFYDARDSDGPRAHAMLGRIRELYQIERQAKELSDDERCALRQREAVPVLDAIEAWLVAELPHVLPKSPIGEAISYTLSNLVALRRYVDFGWLAIDNNASERELRHVVVGRKNWLFCGSVVGGHTAATLFSLIATCNRHRVDPFAYLRDVLLAVHTTPATQIDTLLPTAWATRQQL